MWRVATSLTAHEQPCGSGARRMLRVSVDCVSALRGAVTPARIVCRVRVSVDYVLLLSARRGHPRARRQSCARFGRLRVAALHPPPRASSGARCTPRPPMPPHQRPVEVWEDAADFILGTDGTLDKTTGHGSNYKKVQSVHKMPICTIRIPEWDDELVAALHHYLRAVRSATRKKTQDVSFSFFQARTVCCCWWWWWWWCCVCVRRTFAPGPVVCLASHVRVRGRGGGGGGRGGEGPPMKGVLFSRLCASRR